MTQMRIWSREKYIKRISKIVEYALDLHECDAVPRTFLWDGLGKGEARYSAAWGELATVSNIIACFTAQHTPLGSFGCSVEEPFDSLRLHKWMSKKERKVLIGELYDAYCPLEGENP